MRRYLELLIPPDDLGPPLEWYDAFPVVAEVISLIEAGHTLRAGDLIRVAMTEQEAFLDCLVGELAERIGKNKIGAPAKNSEWRLVGIFDYYNFNTEGRRIDRIKQLSQHCRCTEEHAEFLYKNGKKLALKLEEEYYASAAEHSVNEQDTPANVPDDFAILIKIAQNSRSNSS